MIGSQEVLADTVLSSREMELLSDIAEVYEGFLAVMENGPSREGDLREIIAHIHALQQAVMAQAAARCYPHKFRLLGGMAPSRLGT